MLQANAANSLITLVFDGDANQCLAGRTATSFTRLLATNVSFIHFDYAVQPLPMRSHHRAAQFVQPLPGRVITAQAQYCYVAIPVAGIRAFPMPVLLDRENSP